MVVLVMEYLQTCKAVLGSARFRKDNLEYLEKVNGLEEKTSVFIAGVSVDFADIMGLSNVCLLVRYFVDSSKYCQNFNGAFQIVD
ncbi:hypothetical protein Ancab_016634 [Ancistrocladus abbreviatus]